AATEQPVAVASARQVVGDRHCVEIAGDDDALSSTPTGARQHRVAITLDGEVGDLLEGGLDLVRETSFATGRARDVDQAGREGVTGQRQVDHVTSLAKALQ